MGFRFPGPVGTNLISGQIFASEAVARQATKAIGKKLVRLMFTKSAGRFASKIFLNSKPWQKAFLHVAEHFSTDAVFRKSIHSVFVAPLRSKEALERLILQAVKSPSKKFVSIATKYGEQHLGDPVLVIEREFTEVIGEEFKNVGGQAVKVLFKTVETTVKKWVVQKRTVQKMVNGVMKTVEEEVWKNGKPVMVEVTEKVITQVPHPPCTWLRIIVDYTGRPITVIPFTP